MQSLRFSIIQGPRHRADLGESAGHAWKRFVEDAVLADKLGYDGFMTGEHHFSFASGVSSPYVFLAEVAARTEQIRVGTSVACLPFHNPIRLAEDIAGVDIVSGGRFDFGIGVGSQWEEFHTFGIDPEERHARTWEMSDLIDRCLHGGEEVFSHEGKYYNFPDIRWIFEPIQQRVPFFWGGFGPVGARRAGNRGYELLSYDFTGEYTKALAARGDRIEDHLVGFVHLTSIARTREDAWAAIAEPATWVNNVYRTRKKLDGTVPDADAVRVTPEDVYRDATSGNPQLSFPAFFGTPDDAIEHYLAMIRGETPLGFVNHIGLEVHTPGADPLDVRRSMTLFAQEVMPVLRAEARTIRAQRERAAAEAPATV
jgi:alkanesulfonate monooxygenase SsuD/methylene tetrahydromethanopterin reductase-like flavin-dependent oxidoreductase (luciferase family)